MQNGCVIETGRESLFGGVLSATEQYALEARCSDVYPGVDFFEYRFPTSDNQEGTSFAKVIKCFKQPDLFVGSYETSVPQVTTLRTITVNPGVAPCSDLLS